MPTIRLVYVAVILILFLGIVTAVAQTSSSSLTSVPIDPELFRDGAIKRFTGTRDGWSYVCDEVAKMKKRFCSLRTKLIDADGKVVAALTISTGEDGRPAALLRMSAASFNETGIDVSANAAQLAGPRKLERFPTEGVPGSAKKTRQSKGLERSSDSVRMDDALVDKNKTGVKEKPPAITRLYPAACEAEICQMIWTLPQDHIAALNSGAGLRLQYTAPAPGASQFASALGAEPLRRVDVTIQGRGFAAAVEASVNLAE